MCARGCSHEVLNTFSWSSIWSLLFTLPSASPGSYEDLKGFMLHNRTSSEQALAKRTWEIILWQVLVVKFQKCCCLCVPSKESSIYLHALSSGSNEKDNWPLGFLGKKGALSGKVLEKLIRILNEQIFYCHYISFPRKRDNLTLIAYQRNGRGLWQMNVWDTGWTFRYRRNKAKQIIFIIIICECICVGSSWKMFLKSN